MLPSETCLTLKCITAKARVKCGSNWEERPHSEYCYQFNTDLNDLAGALAKCEEQQSSLVSIVTPQEQAYISGMYNMHMLQSKRHALSYRILNCGNMSMHQIEPICINRGDSKKYSTIFIQTTVQSTNPTHIIGARHSVFSSFQWTSFFIFKMSNDFGLNFCT